MARAGIVVTISCCKGLNPFLGWKRIDGAGLIVKYHYIHTMAWTVSASKLISGVTGNNKEGCSDVGEEELYFFSWSMVVVVVEWVVVALV